MVDSIAAPTSPLSVPSESSVQATLPAAIGSVVASPLHLSPTMELHVDIGIVVIQYWNQRGTVELSIPSQHQLDAYAADPFVSFKSAEAMTA